MKGKSTFSRSEADAIISLIRLKLQASSEEQKRIRDRIRKIGFYISDFDLPRHPGGYNEFDFLKVVSIIDEKQAKPQPKTIIVDKPTTQPRLVEGLHPISNKNSKILILGSMPGAESLRKQEYYGNPRNLFWKLLAEVTGVEAPYGYTEKQNYLRCHGIALWDMCAVCVRPGSLDSNITEEIPNDIRSFLVSHPYIKTIACNGGKAYKLFQKYVGDLHNIKILRLPSSSPANASITWEKKVESWRKIKG